jgi:hypothetical protein
MRGAGVADIWIVLAEDRYGDTDALPFSEEDPAVRYARTRAGHDGITQEEMTAAMREEGLALVVPHGEGCIRFRVIRRTLDAGS